jgi:hypothetical protein
VLDGAARRIGREERQALALAYNTAAFNALTKTKGGLKPFDHYTRRKPEKPTPTHILANLQEAAVRSKVMRIRAVPRKEASDGDHAGIAADQPRPQ